MSISHDHAKASPGGDYIGQNFIFMRDNEHTARVRKDYMQHLEQSDESKLMHWPTQSPDLNKIGKSVKCVQSSKMTCETNYKLRGTKWYHKQWKN